MAALALGCGVAPQARLDGARRFDARATSAGTWLAVQLHAHSKHSDGVFTVPELIGMAKKEGLDALGLSEHDTTTQWLDPAFVAEKELVMLHSEEARDNHEDNHMGVHGFSGVEPLVKLPREQGLDEAARRGGTVVANHPRNRFVPWKPLTWDSRVHAIEVWNGWWMNPLLAASVPHPESVSSNEEAVGWWADLLAAGARVSPIAASDFHRKPQNLASPCTLVYATERTEAAILAGIRAGRTLLAEHPRRQRVMLTADPDRDGSFGAMVGDAVPRGATFRVHAKNARGNVLRLMVGLRPILQTRVPSADWQHDFTLPADAAPTDRFVYARVDEDFAIRRMQAMTGAIYLR
ncbi:MAG: CehA/McbA family metallohydrolase [Candidatus Sericytochromatia bacterium]|nr:CehA/McbA family metallohydrolase [Candidatus Tanganyikabacteria bacterium]